MPYLTNGKLGEILVNAGQLSVDDLMCALDDHHQHPKERLGETLLRLQLVDEVELAKALACQLHVPYVDLTADTIDPQAVQKISQKLAFQKQILPVALEGKKLLLAMRDPQDLEAIDMAQFASGLNVRPCIAAASALENAIHRYYAAEEGGNQETEESFDAIIQEVPHQDTLEVMADENLNEEGIMELKKKSELAPIVKLVNSIIFQGISAHASDIHIEPQEKEVVVRNRVDGVLSESSRVPGWIHAALVSRIKIMAELDISKRRIPQDGRVKVRLQNNVVDLRISTLPTQYGEKVVMRILETQKNILRPSELGFHPKELKKVADLIQLPQGMILVCGPTGSGKTTTLYALLGEIAQKQINIVTLEDPIEYRMSGVNQVQVNEKAGLTFAASLRSILRQDPDVILVGETRDAETAETAMRASMTGHLVFSTLHTNDAVATITRLKNLGIDSYLVASAVSGIISQRLVRAICEHCREEYELPPETRTHFETLLGEELSFPVYRGTGCERCRQTGYHGRVGVHEVLVMDGTLRELIDRDEPEGRLRDEARKSGMQSLFEDTLEKITQGITTIDELERVLFQYEKPKALKELTCGRCRQPVQAEWQTCPFCSSELKSTVTPEKGSLPDADEIASSDDIPAWNHDEFRDIKVLLVDRDDAAARELAFFLMKKHFQVIPVDNEKEALSAMAHDRPHIVITENTSPEMDGLELLRHIRHGTATASLPVLILSHKKEVMDQWGGFMMGADDYLIKPCPPEIVECHIRAVLRRCLSRSKEQVSEG